MNTSYVGFHAQRTLSDSVEANSQVVYNDVRFEVGGAYDAGSGNFICPVNGYYFFSVSCFSDVSFTIGSKFVYLHAFIHKKVLVFRTTTRWEN